MNLIRKKKIERAIIREVSNLLLYGKVKDPRIEMVSVHRAELSADAGSVKIFFTAICPKRKQKTLLIGLNNASGYIQSVVGTNLKLRRTPKIRFIWDGEFIDNLDPEFRIEKV